MTEKRNRIATLLDATRSCQANKPLDKAQPLP